MVAEMANTFSNLITISIGLYGTFRAWNQRLPQRYWTGFSVSLSCFKLFRRVTQRLGRVSLLLGSEAWLSMPLCFTRLNLLMNYQWS
jgi:hypothetical protein